MQFTKLFNSILDSTIWQEPLETKVVWITMLAMVDRNGEVHASIPGLAKRAGVTLQQCNAALACLESPDKYSRTKDHEGRRIGEIDGGWQLLNHAKYRALLSAEERREYNRRKQAEYRSNKRENVNDMSMTVNDSQLQSTKCTHTEAEAESDSEASTKEKARRERFTKPSAADVAAYGASLSPPFLEAENFVDFYESKGWTVGKQPMKDWKATVRTWHRRQKNESIQGGKSLAQRAAQTVAAEKASGQYREEAF